jgi:hypothetical protein
MASRFIGGAMPGGRNTLDVPVAALAGLSVAFAVFAAPEQLLSNLVAATGLAAIVPAAEPPLGMNARLVIGAAGAVLVFAIAFAALRWLDRVGRRSREPEAEAEVEGVVPRLRRRDFHPDASPRPPLLAVKELGEPEDDPLTELELQQGPVLDLYPWEEPFVVTQPEPEPEAIFEDEPEAEAETEAEEPRFVRRSWLPEEPVAPPPEFEPVADERPVEQPRPVAGSIAELLDRLERGLARRRVEPSAPAPTAVQAQEPVPFPVSPASDDRLQSAINSLQRLASRKD